MNRTTARSNVLSMPQEQDSKRNSQSVQKPARKRRFKGRHLLLFGCLAWASYVFFFVQSPNLNRLNHEQQQLNADLQQVVQTNADLQKRIDQLQDPSFIAEVARGKYQMVKDGETLFIESK